MFGMNNYAAAAYLIREGGAFLQARVESHPPLQQKV